MNFHEGLAFSGVVCYLVIRLDNGKEDVMGYPTRVQLIERRESQQWYINFPAPLAAAGEAGGRP